MDQSFSCFSLQVLWRAIVHGDLASAWSSDTIGRCDPLQLAVSTTVVSTPIAHAEKVLLRKQILW